MGSETSFFSLSVHADVTAAHLSALAAGFLLSLHSHCCSSNTATLSQLPEPEKTSTLRVEWC
ncbi:Hypothetical predicted protein [Scomber scombrus]|uniref:Uncharacterized protein n=1 Tax=Scomber scombrus TaxID=13677 RepID=A0AAV1PHG3_SCOSC